MFAILHALGMLVADLLGSRDLAALLLVLSLIAFSFARHTPRYLAQKNACRFRKLDSRVSMMEPTKDRVCNNISKPLNRVCVGRVLPERNMSSYVIIIGDVFR